MRHIFAILLILLLVSCNSSDFSPAKDTVCQAPFVDLANSGTSQEDQAILREASEDFCAVVSGKKPVHAKFDTTADLPSDGGTLFYIGHKYKLTVLNSLSGFGTFHGTAHGPIITFDEPFAQGNTNVISSIRVYPLPKSPRDGR
jgi:hypothetical protein